MLQLLHEAMTVEQAAEKIGLPLYRVRSGLREMLNSGFVRNEGDKYVVTDTGRAKSKLS